MTVVKICLMIVFRTPEGCDQLDQRDSGEEEEEGLYPCPAQSTIKEEPGHDSDLDEPVFDIGIRRSDSSKVSEKLKLYYHHNQV